MIFLDTNDITKILQKQNDNIRYHTFFMYKSYSKGIYTYNISMPKLVWINIYIGGKLMNIVKSKIDKNILHWNKID